MNQQRNEFVRPGQQEPAGNLFFPAPELVMEEGEGRGYDV